MKPFSEQDLIAYHLHELSPRKSRAIESVLDTDSAFAAESEAVAATLRAFKEDTPMPITEDVLARNWQALRPSLGEHVPPPKAFLRWQLPALAGGALALVLASFLVVTHLEQAIDPQQEMFIRQPGETAQTSPATGNPWNAHSSLRKERGQPGIGSVKATFSSRHAASAETSLSRRAMPASFSPAPAAIPHFIPLATVPLPAPPAESANRITLEPAASTTPLQKVSLSYTTLSSKPKLVRPGRQMDLTAAMGGTLIHSRYVTEAGTPGTYLVGATHAVSAIAAFHQQLRPLLGYRIQVSYSRPGFQYGYGTTTPVYAGTSVSSQAYELATTYVAQGPHFGAFNTSIEAGAALIAFLPPSPRSDDTFRPGAVVGLAADYALTKHIGIHAAYRAQAYKAPDDTGVWPTQEPKAIPVLFSSEPSLGITFRFPHK